MKDDFFDWLENCPVTWFLNGTEPNGNRSYIFIDNGEEGEEEEY